MEYVLLFFAFAGFVLVIKYWPAKKNS